ncbi:hypothetical protein DENSPDRAFT_884850 [Dentipellis sp. KUC8613]|nr:hypothetical protein DENSPDRAFT_884850 [Dentipellis sp. KUC8613]
MDSCPNTPTSISTADIPITLDTEDFIRISTDMDYQNPYTAPEPTVLALKNASHRTKRFATLILPSRSGNTSKSSGRTPSQSTSSGVISNKRQRTRTLSEAQAFVERTRAQWAARERPSLDAGSGNGMQRTPFRALQPVADVASDVILTIPPARSRRPSQVGEKTLPPRPVQISMDAASPTLLNAPGSPTLPTSPISRTSVTFIADGPEPRSPLPLADESPRPGFRQSRADELEEVQQEATLRMIESGRGMQGIPCGRPGCTDVLKDVKALTFHLHIHDIHERTAPRRWTCSSCAGSYESRRELSMHSCSRHRASSSIRCPYYNPFRVPLRRIAALAVCCKPDPNSPEP